MFLQNKTAVGKVKTRPNLIHIQMECLQYVPVNSKTAHPPGQTKAQHFIKRWSYWTLQKEYKERKVGPTKTHDDKGGKFLPI